MRQILRRCSVCRTQLPKEQLRRHVFDGDRLERDPEHRSMGRGYYACSDECEIKLEAVAKKQRARKR